MEIWRWAAETSRAWQQLFGQELVGHAEADAPFVVEPDGLDLSVSLQCSNDDDNKQQHACKPHPWRQLARLAPTLKVWRREDCSGLFVPTRAAQARPTEVVSSASPLAGAAFRSH